MIVLVLYEPIDHVQHLTMDLENLGLKLIIIDRHILSQKSSSYETKTGKADQEVMYYSKSFNSHYMDFVGDETRVILIWISGKICRNTNAISKQGIPQINMNMTSPSATLGFGFPPIRALVISCLIFFHIDCKHIHQ